MQERVQKILSQWGIASRRQAEQMILEGRVRLNGDIAHLGQKANPEHDRVEVDGQLIQPTASSASAGIARPQLVYLLLNKPVGVVSTCHDPQKRPTVLELLPKKLRQGKGLHPVGRLDVESTGALILTNDGELTYQLTHPRHYIPKTYEVWVEGSPSASVLRQWRDGVMLDGQITMPAEIEVLKRTASRTLLQIILREGRNRQIRRIAEQLGHSVLQLHRSAIGSVQLQSSGKAPVPSGKYRPLDQLEIQCLKHQIDLPSIRVPAQTKEQQSV